jgi:hypothetical protein
MLLHPVPKHPQFMFFPQWERERDQVPYPY